MMVHVFLNAADGLVLRSRFYIGGAIRLYSSKRIAGQAPCAQPPIVPSLYRIVTRSQSDGSPLRTGVRQSGDTAPGATSPLLRQGLAAPLAIAANALGLASHRQVARQHDEPAAISFIESHSIDRLGGQLKIDNRPLSGGHVLSPQSESMREAAGRRAHGR